MTTSEEAAAIARVVPPLWAGEAAAVAEPSGASVVSVRVRTVSLRGDTKWKGSHLVDQRSHPQFAVPSFAVSFEHPRTSDPDGREVVFDVGSRLHLGERRPWLLDHIDVILGAVARPDHRAFDPIPNRERFYRQHIEPGRWLRVVVDYGRDPAWVVTAVEQDNDPRTTL